MAEPMTMTEAQKVLGRELKPSTIEEDGYLVEYKDGYKSWSPKSVFEEAYREFGYPRSFGGAICLLKAGFQVRRANWSGNKFLYFVPSESYPAMTDIEKSVAEDGMVLYKPYIAIRCKDGGVGFYTPTQCDVLAEDWVVVDQDLPSLVCSVDVVKG